MEAKTSYSSMAAKPPTKANDASPTHVTKPKNPTGNKRNLDQFVGHNQSDLKEMLIPEDANAKHYNELKDRLKTLGLQPTAAEYLTPVTDPVTQETQMDELKKKADEWIQYQRDMEKVYRLALGQINDGMKAKLKGLKSWKAIDSSKCIVALLKAVRDLCFQSSRTKVHPITNVIRTIRKLLCTQQCKMMKENLDVVKSLGGTLICKATVSYELERNSAYTAYDYSTYLTLTGPTRAAIDHALNNHPTTSVEALDMVVAFKDSKKSKPRGSNHSNAPIGTSQHGQGQRDNRKKDESPDQGSSLFAQQGSGGGGTTNLSTDQHSRQLLMTAVESGEAFTPSEQTTYMFLNIRMLSQEGTKESDSDSTTSFTSSSSGWSNSDYDSVPDLVPRTNRYPDDDNEADYHFSNDVEYLFTQSKFERGVNPYWILLDSESSLNLIVNPELVEKIRQAPNNGFMNIHCNSGISRTNMIADLPGFGTVWIYEDGLANVLSLALVLDQYWVTMDTDIDNAIHVHKENGTRRFQRSTCNLYYCDMREQNGTVLALDTVEGKAQSYSTLDCSRAKKALDLQEVLGFPTTQELIRMIDNNIIKDCPITRRDISIMEAIYGKHTKDVTPVPDSILNSYHDVTLFVDIITVNSVQFLVFISRHLRFRTAVAINNMKHHTLAKAIWAIAGQYLARGFCVTQVHADNQFDCIRDNLLDMDYPITMHCVPAGQHEPTIERSNQTLKENIRCVVNHIPVSRLPRRCLIELVYATVFWLNCRTTGVPPPYSHRRS
eukprot:jgi/Psemu1/54543/gm1.54543_g